jgi:hypothetical protein
VINTYILDTIHVLIAEQPHITKKQNSTGKHIIKKLKFLDYSFLVISPKLYIEILYLANLLPTMWIQNLEQHVWLKQFIDFASICRKYQNS